MIKYFILFIAAISLSLILTPMARAVARRVGAIDQPGERKIHSLAVPRLGGLAVFITFYTIFLLSYRHEYFYFPANFFDSLTFEWLFIASCLMMLLGAVDDFRRIPPGIKLIFQIFIALIVALKCVKIDLISMPFGTFELGLWAIPLTVLWIVTITNAINIIDGLDGLAAGISFIICSTIFGISILNQNIGIALISAILAGSILGFLRYNFHPAKIFLGDSGSYFLGFMLSVLPLVGSFKGSATVAILIPLLALGLPIIETFLSVIRRFLGSLRIIEADGREDKVKFFLEKSKSVFQADGDHIHHRFLRMGFTHRKTVLIFYVISLALAGMALLSVYFTNMNTGLFITAVGIASYAGIKKLGYTEVQVLSNGALLPLFDVPVVSRRILRVFVDLALIAGSYYLAFLLRFEGGFDIGVRNYILNTIPLVLAVKVTIFYGCRLYEGAWRYTNLGDLLKMVRAVILGCFVSGAVLYILPGFGILSRAALLIDFNLLLFMVVGARSSFRVLEHLYATRKHGGRKALIYGVDKGGIRALREIIDTPGLGLNMAGFIDDEPKNRKKEVNGYPVLGTLSEIEGYLQRNSISEIILSHEDIPTEKLNYLLRLCNSYHIAIKRFHFQIEEVSH